MGKSNRKRPFGTGWFGQLQERKLKEALRDEIADIVLLLGCNEDFAFDIARHEMIRGPNLRFVLAALEGKGTNEQA